MSFKSTVARFALAAVFASTNASAQINHNTQQVASHPSVEARAAAARQEIAAALTASGKTHGDFKAYGDEIRAISENEDLSPYAKNKRTHALVNQMRIFVGLPPARPSDEITVSAWNHFAREADDPDDISRGVFTAMMELRGTIRTTRQAALSPEEQQKVLLALTSHRTSNSAALVLDALSQNGALFSDLKDMLEIGTQSRDSRLTMAHILKFYAEQGIPSSDLKDMIISAFQTDDTFTGETLLSAVRIMINRGNMDAKDLSEIFPTIKDAYRVMILAGEKPDFKRIQAVAGGWEPLPGAEPLLSPAPN